MLRPHHKRAVGAQLVADPARKGGSMNFEVNGIPYFLTFDTNEAQWCLLTPSRSGVESVEIHNDGARLTAAAWALAARRRRAPHELSLPCVFPNAAPAGAASWIGRRGSKL